MSRTPSIRRRLVVGLLAGTLSVSCATVVVVYIYLRDEIVEQYDWALTVKARALAGLVGTGPDGEPTFTFHPSAMPEYHTQPRDTDYFQIWRADGSVLARSPSLGTANLPSGEVPALAHGGDTALADVALPGGRIGRSAWLRFGIQDNPPGKSPMVVTATVGTRPAAAGSAANGLLIAVATSGEEFDETIRHLMTALVAAGVAMSAGTVLVVVVAVRRGLRPLNTVADAAARIDAATLDARFGVEEMPAELRPIALRLNALLERLEQAFGRERRFTANVAHELRTPIAELRTSAEIATRWPEEVELAHKAVRDSLAVAKQMETVVTALLAVVRCEAGRQAPAIEEIDLADAVRLAWGPHLPLAHRRRLDVAVAVPDGTRVLADVTLLAGILGNLFSNAATYAPLGTRIGCAAMVGNDLVTLRVANDNPGLDPEDQNRLVEPFWRKDAARTDMDHAGLGLSLVQAYTDAMQSGVVFEVTSAVFAVTISLPRIGRSTPAFHP